ncbi:CDP-glycerol glycerophosphotransferase family protein [Agathobacter ruminis]|uniref:Glycosyl transferase family 1 domain-containing protein n=1 Tax=Agathobacter ruminis TaxID=1712665 RepID=A0A2G3E4I9_9FIRM|nr:CDP-glycerol glycerophosphotransferase family protein [Agathobacter ruminis]MDC7302060.1 CDP-glycerol glycerophosphotransferase family protein [Agathobacter ruminis]PHU38196.1 hypothetical protein CSX02_04080 [Agathobacter ruminis]
MAKSSKLKKLKKIKRNLSAWRIRGSYYRNYKRASLKDHYILVESKNGDDIAGNMFSILSELTNQEYQSFHIFLAAKLEKMEQFQELLANNGITNVKIIESGTRKYYKLLATAKYIFLDTSLNRDYMKKDGQIITNTWHGTPLKLMGMQVKDRAYAMGNVQRNLQMADYLVYPNRLMKDIMFKAYCLDNLYQGTVLMSGYPRNSIFFDQKAADSVRKEIGYENKKLYVYMPTWRGSLNKLDVTKQVDEMEYLLRELDATMSDDVTILAKLHPFVGDAIDFSGFHHIHAFPKNLDSYRVLNAADGLVTDYSSVFFDFVNTRKKIIIWAYDKYAYLGERGTYVALEDMPFPVVASPKELAEEMQKGKSYDESDFIEKNGFCDCPEATRNLCHHVLLNENCCNAEKNAGNGKENVFFYVSTLAKNGITTSILSLMEHLDLKDKNYFAVFREKTFARYPERLEVLPENVSIWPISSEPRYSLKDKWYAHLYFAKNRVSKRILRHIEDLYSREIKRHFNGVKVDYAVHFTGYEKHVINIFGRLQAERTIIVHNDMTEELKTKDNQHRPTLEWAYANYDHVGIVSKDLEAPTRSLGAKDSNLCLTYNCHAYETILKKADEPIVFQKHTETNTDQETILQALESEGQKFINIGRFSYEKGHDMLIQAFTKYYKEHPDAKLFLIGGYGNLYRKTLRKAAMSPAKNNIFIIRQIDNPMPILKKCDFFILSSRYEGFGLVLLEADTVGVPVASTEIVGPTGFMRENGGYLVPPTVKGIYQAMRSYDRGEIQPLNIDYEKYNQNAAEQFRKVIGG